MGHYYGAAHLVLQGHAWKPEFPVRVNGAPIFLMAWNVCDVWFLTIWASSSTRARHEQAWKVLGSRLREHEGVRGAAFAVWAPNAHAVRIIGDFTERNEACCAAT